MDMANVSLTGWVHTFASLVALFTGAIVLFRRKGTHQHRLIGRIYAGALLFAGFTAFWIYRFDIQFVPFKVGPNIFGLLHYETVFTLAVLLLALFTARRQRQAFSAYAHPASMLLAYYMVVGGFINELFVRVAPLRGIAEAQLEGRAANVAQAPIARATHFGAFVAFVLLLVWFMVAVWLRRRRGRSTGALEAVVPTR